MLNSEIIVGLWFVPVVLFVIIPLVMLCAWEGVQLLRKITGKIGQVQRSAQEVLNTSYGASLRPRHAV